jgi:hypothetical protein
MKFKLLLLTFFISVLTWGQTIIDNTATGAGGVIPAGWTGVNNYTTQSIPQTASGGYYLVESSGGVTDYLESNTYSSINGATSVVIDFDIATYGAGTNSPLNVDMSLNGGSTWTSTQTSAGTPTSSTFISTSVTFTGPVVSSNVKFRFYDGIDGFKAVRIKNIVIKAFLSLPTITISPTTLTGFTYVVGSGPSAQQNFTASGSNLTANISITAPVNYEISTTSGSGYTNSLTLVQTGGNVSSTPIYVRLKAALGVGVYNGQLVSLISTGATTQNVTCDGNVTGSNNSDIIAVAASEAVVISSTINNAAPLTSSTGVQVWQFTVRDGGGVADADNLPTILTGFNLAQGAGNQVGTWSDAIETVALFDGTTFIASGVVTSNQIQFTGLNINVADNTNKTLSLRLSLKCPLGADAFDGEDFVFSLSNTNTTFSSTGSGKSSFTAAISNNGSNVIDVIATKLLFTSQPNSTGMGSPMSDVVVKATDVCGNTDVNFTGSITITSTGSMTGNPITVSAVSGVATYSGIIHTALGTGLTLNSTSTGLTSILSNSFNITTVTAFSQGDFAVIALNSNISCYPPGPNGAYSAGDDEISFMIFKDIQNGDTFYITDNGYERTTLGLWGDTEGVTQIVRTGGTIPAGTVITIRLRNSGPIMEFVSPDTNWSFTKASGFSGNLVMNSGGDQIFFMQGGVWNNPAGSHDATYTPGTFLYAFNTNSSWTSLGSSTQQSALPLDLKCFSLMPGSASDYLEYTGPTTPADKLDWIARLNNPTNWTNTVSCAGYTQTHNGQSYSVTTSGTYVNGVWTGSKNTDWFDCSNWQTLKVPDALVNVDVNSTYAIRDAVIDVGSINAPIYGNIARANDVTISSNKIQLEGNVNNVLEIHGNLLINSGGSLDMDDGTAASDGTIHLYGNWTNNAGNASFLEGNGTVHFDGTVDQIINNVTPVGTEEFYNVVMNNNFTTSVSNNLIATGNLNVNTSKTVLVNADDFIQVNNNLTNNGTFTIEDDGSLIQVNNSAVNTGSINYQRNTSGVPLDYVFWSSPVNGVNTPTGYIYSWSPTIANPNGGEGNWINAASTLMQAGSGYIMRGVLSRNFTGLPRNGIVTPSISRGNNIGSGSVGPNGVMRTDTDDNWNLIGNPYPSSISVNSFLSANSNIDGFVRLWTHGTLPSTAITDPFYDNFVSNYTAADYIAINGAGATSGPGTLSVVGGAQSFFVLMNPGVAATETITINNSMRSRDYSNSQFYRSSENANIEKNRIWLDLLTPNNVSTRALVAYISDATNERDRMYDAITDYKSAQNFYSMIENEIFAIQGRATFVSEDKVPLGFISPVTGINLISIAAVDGLFDGQQDIYIEDKELNIIHDLRQRPYSFYAQSGIHNERFVLRYTDGRLSNDDNQFNDDDLFVLSNDNIQIISNSEAIQEVEIFDVLGRKLISKKNVDSNSIIIDEIVKSNNALIINVVLNNNVKICRKVLF